MDALASCTAGTIPLSPPKYLHHKSPEIGRIKLHRARTIFGSFGKISTGIFVSGQMLQGKQTNRFLRDPNRRWCMPADEKRTRQIGTYKQRLDVFVYFGGERSVMSGRPKQITRLPFGPPFAESITLTPRCIRRALFPPFDTPIFPCWRDGSFQVVVGVLTHFPRPHHYQSTDYYYCGDDGTETLQQINRFVDPRRDSSPCLPPRINRGRLINYILGNGKLSPAQRH